MKQLAFRIETVGTELATALPDYDNNLTLAALVPDQSTITAMCFDIGGPDLPGGNGRSSSLLALVSDLESGAGAGSLPFLRLGHDRRE
ncbi:hypothetical protein [Bradyrhizobium lablabi]|uniref:hypothetical protein n=1 Tax=Bradyrhizobium lablabi TaxID=722472 RepID=UPI001BA7F328|nr:hypothetical protein [Bradyrhizobium lablabi]MBR0696010.1 hypothetical protein [Bradyrhizobium lablabi]